jgi:hypothetical protein
MAMPSTASASERDRVASGRGFMTATGTGWGFTAGLGSTGVSVTTAPPGGGAPNVMGAAGVSSAARDIHLPLVMRRRSRMTMETKIHGQKM